VCFVCVCVRACVCVCAGSCIFVCMHSDISYFSCLNSPLLVALKNFTHTRDFYSISKFLLSQISTSRCNADHCMRTQLYHIQASSPGRLHSTCACLCPPLKFLGTAIRVKCKHDYVSIVPLMSSPPMLTCAHGRTCTHTYTHTRTHTRTHIHTHTRTHTQTNTHSHTPQMRS